MTNQMARITPAHSYNTTSTHILSFPDVGPTAETLELYKKLLNYYYYCKGRMRAKLTAAANNRITRSKTTSYAIAVSGKESAARDTGRTNPQGSLVPNPSPSPRPNNWTPS